MHGGGGRRMAHRAINVWPGWVDALSSLIMVIIFLLLVFVVAQFYLSHTLSGRDQALVRLNQKIAELSDLLNLERQGAAELRLNIAQVADQLQGSVAAREQQGTALAALGGERDRLAARLAEALRQGEAAGADAARLGRELEDAYKQISAGRETIEVQLRDLARLQADLKALAEARQTLEGQVAALTLLRTSLEERAAALAAKLDRTESAAGKQATQAEAERRRLDGALAELADRLKQAAAEREREATASAAARTALEAAGRDKTRLEESLRLSEEQRKLLLEQLGSLRDHAKTLEARVAGEAERTLLAQKEIEVRETRLAELVAALAASRQALTGEKAQSAEGQQQIGLLNQQIQALRAELARLTQALEGSESKGKAQQAQIEDLSGRLNLALARKVEELARYRSEFFGRLREAIGARPDIRIVGDRFVFQSEVLFGTGSAVLEEAGKAQLLKLARTLLDIALTIPPEVNWLLRVDGHTDPRRIATFQFPSNWELSTARAISVVKFLVEQGIPAERLAATGFGEYQPLEGGSAEDAYARNRRIELKLDQR
jgi:chemotaxis protein MotB